MMKAAILRRPGQIETAHVPIPRAAAPEEVVASVLYVGLCKTDNHLTRQCPVPDVILGHEVVCRLPDEPRANVYYVLNNEVCCGACGYCREGLTSHCTQMSELGVNRNGGYAEWLLAPRRNLHPITLEQPAVGVFAEPLSCAVRGAERILKTAALLPVNQPEVLVVGGGISGKLVTYALRRRGFSGRMRFLDVTREPLGWPAALEANQLSEVPSQSYHVVIECSGSAGGLETAFAAARNAGVVCLYGVPADGAHLPVSASSLFKKELTVLTSCAGTNDATMSDAISYIQQDEGFFQKLLGRFVRLEELGHELTRWQPYPGTRTVVELT